MIRTLAALAILLTGAGAGSSTSGNYAGTVTFTDAESSGMGLVVGARTATVSLGPGHVSHVVVPLRREAGTLRFAVPGLPRPVVFSLRASGRRLVGTAVQGAARATVTLARGRASGDAALGYFASPQVELARFTRFGFSTRPVAIEQDTGRFTAAVPTAGRVAMRQYEVRIPVAGATLAGTLTVPPGPGPHPAYVYVSGSGPTLREEAHWFDSAFVSRGIAVLSYDKRGIGQSGGHYPGDLASATAIDQLAGDAAAAARFLAAQPEIDARHVGLVGISQAGWIIPQAAVRARGTVSWAVIESGPTVTQGESDAYGSFVSQAKSLADAEAKAQANGAFGYDPVPWIRKLAIPVLWLYGGQDRNQPVHRSMSILQSLSAGHDFEVDFFPTAPHPLFDAHGFPPTLFGTVRNWLAGQSLGS
jgi:hypothetical protein